MEGDPVFYNLVSITDFDELLQKSSLERIEHFNFAHMIRVIGIVLPHCSKAENRRVEKITIVFDFKNVNAMKFLKGDLKQIITMVIN